jgi:hypothetical protein
MVLLILLITLKALTSKIEIVTAFFFFQKRLVVKLLKLSVELIFIDKKKGKSKGCQ